MGAGQRRQEAAKPGAVKLGGNEDMRRAYERSKASFTAHSQSEARGQRP